MNSDDTRIKIPFNEEIELPIIARSISQILEAYLRAMDRMLHLHARNCFEERYPQTTIMKDWESEIEAALSAFNYYDSEQIKKIKEQLANDALSDEDFFEKLRTQEEEMDSENRAHEEMNVDLQNKKRLDAANYAASSCDDDYEQPSVANEHGIPVIHFESTSSEAGKEYLIDQESSHPSIEECISAFRATHTQKYIDPSFRENPAVEKLTTHVEISLKKIHAIFAQRKASIDP